MLFILLVLLFVGTYFLWLNFPAEQTSFEEYAANVSGEFPLESAQFHPNMRYSDREIGYFVSENCSLKKKNDFKDAVQFLEDRTILSFYEDKSKPEIWVSCSNIAPEPDEEGHFVAGEGGPRNIINASRFAVILIGEIALYHPETCEIPQVAVHELLHALGFDHNSNKKSIMFPVTSCDQILDQGIIDDINNLYSIDSAPDLVVENVKANKTGKYLNLGAVVANYGLKGSKSSSMNLVIDGKTVKTLELGELTIGSRKSLTLSNLVVPRSTNKITILIETNENELDKNNNFAVISVAV